MKEPAGAASAKRAREGSGRVRLDEVARRADVSTATVSRVFNEPDKVSDSVKQRVREAARALNWIPNAAGRALASRRTHIAGAIIPTLDNEIFAYISAIAIQESPCIVPTFSSPASPRGNPLTARGSAAARPRTPRCWG